MLKVEQEIAIRAGSKVSIVRKNGIQVRTPSITVALDPKSASSCDYTFVSHAHIDHVHSPNGKSKVICSNETKALAKIRGYDLGDTSEKAPGLELIDAGHILGSRAILIEDSVLYTGDFSKRDRAFLKGLSGVKCETLIMETTYGMPRYAFRDTAKVVADVSRVIANCFHQCRPVVLCGYPLGKAQLISYLFHNWDPIYAHESVHKMNSAHIDMGVSLRNFEPYYLRSSKKKESSVDTLALTPWVMIAPLSSSRSGFIKMLKEKYGALIIGFTGWALDSSYKYMMGLDYAFDISDHSDFPELVEFAKNCSPSRIYTVHGFAAEFAAHLTTLGFDAQPLDGEGVQQSTLTSYG